MRGRIKAGEAYVGLGVRNKLKAGLKKASAQLKKFGTGIKKLGTPILASGGAIAAALVPAINKASEFQERFSKFQTVFGKNSQAVKEWGDEFAGQVGRSKSDITNFLASSQDLLIPIGLDEATATETSKQLTKLAVDLASFNNTSDDDAMRDLQAALTGSGEVMKKYGVIVSEAAVKQELLNRNIEPKSATEAQKAMARLGIIMEGTTAAQGDALRTAGSFANQMKALRASFSDFLVAAGTPLLDMLASFAGTASNAIRVVTELVTQNKGLVIAAAGVAAALIAGGSAIVGFGLAATVAGAAVAGIASAAAVVLSPIGLIVGGITAATVAFFTFTETGRNVVDWFVSNFKKIFDSVTSVVGSISDALQAGDMALAAEIGFTAVKLAIGTILDEIESLFGVSFESMFQVVAQLGKSIAQVVGKLNQARQGAVNFLSEGLGSLVLSAEAQKVLSEDNKRASERAANFTDSINNFDADQFGSDINNALDVESLSAKLEQLKRQAKEAREAAQSPETLEKADPFSVELRAKLQQAAKASFANFVGLSARASQRSGPGARKIEDKILAENEKQTDLLEQIRDKKGGLKFS